MTLPKYKEIHNKQYHDIMQHVPDDITWQSLVKLYNKKNIYKRSQNNIKWQKTLKCQWSIRKKNRVVEGHCINITVLPQNYEKQTTSPEHETQMRT